MRKYKKNGTGRKNGERRAAVARAAAVCGGWRAAGVGRRVAGGGRRVAGGGWRAAGGEQRAVRIIGDVLRSKRPQTARPQDRKTARPQNSARVQTFSKN